jgi:hypothetical protein
MKKIALEDLVTLVCTEFVKLNKARLQGIEDMQYDYNCLRIPYLKMNFMKRRKLSEKLIDKMLKDYEADNDLL